MRVPTAEELAAIAAAYLTVTRRDAVAAPADDARWRIAGRLPSIEGAPHARAATRTGMRWKMAGRLDG